MNTHTEAICMGGKEGDGGREREGEGEGGREGEVGKRGEREGD